ncbi:hypothetical protein LI224_19765, partial [Erysipelatoclostridium ramosum]|uniref:hypothetical protein n=1 Tax=Thomasclavelia ramosa TaxID=1547 RepID=UPI001D078503
VFGENPLNVLLIDPPSVTARADDGVKFVHPPPSIRYLPNVVFTFELITHVIAFCDTDETYMPAEPPLRSMDGTDI